ncbi:MAG: hypothetical protein H8E26_03540 [FCB group bacterium]|nr:hypothetical protein [FCB group bacterium]MBL7028205.1 hypothetical protein [Candidatus Neomarinimicrobiota bacterium]MBL7122489.1 hypothetical protein [Candidatus Neomarinimicrobiota bacterium]
MKKSNHDEIQGQVKLTLDAFRQDEPPEMDPWFYDRLNNRIEHELNPDTPAIEAWWSRVVKPGMLVGLVTLNLIMMVWIAVPNETSASGRSDYIENLSSQYGLNYADTYLLSEEGE